MSSRAKWGNLWRKRKQGGSARFFLPVSALLALIWFLLRVPAKPSRINYPCQRASLSLIGNSMFWVTTLLLSSALYRRGRYLIADRSGRVITASIFFTLITGAILVITSPNEPTRAMPQLSNDPIGIARGINPGRVVWVHDPDATDWIGPDDGFWWEADHTSSVVVEAMMSEALQHLSGETSDTAAWDQLLRYYNVTHGFGDVGYTAGEKITIKVNFVGAHYLWGGTNPETYLMETKANYMNTSPQMILALLRQLTLEAGVAAEDISVGDPLCLFPEEYYQLCHSEFPAVHYLDYFGGNIDHPRTGVPLGDAPMYWSVRPEEVIQDYFPTCYSEVKYLINFANFKSHSHSGVTFCAKNHYGSLARIPIDDGYFDMHLSLANIAPDPAVYRALVDMIGHEQTGGKTVLYLIDGLYAGVHPEDTEPRRWQNAPFYGDWTSSLFASQDPIAIDSVCFDLMQIEGDPRLYPQMPGADDYLHEAALANNPPSGTYYDPNHEFDVERLTSLGVHEHWNNPVDRLYSRNLGTGDGIELDEIHLSASIETDRYTVGGSKLDLFPNPGDQATTIRFKLAADQNISLGIFTINGRLAVSLVRGYLVAGDHDIVWNGNDEFGERLPSGIYLSRLETETDTVTSRVIRLR